MPSARLTMQEKALLAFLKKGAAAHPEGRARYTWVDVAVYMNKQHNFDCERADILDMCRRLKERGDIAFVTFDDLYGEVEV